MTNDGEGKTDFLGRELKVGQWVVTAVGQIRVARDALAIFGDTHDAEYAKAFLRLGKVVGFGSQVVFIDGRFERRLPCNVCIVDSELAEQALVFGALTL